MAGKTTTKDTRSTVAASKSRRVGRDQGVAKQAAPRNGEGWQAEKSALTRKAILESAVRCFVQDGYTKTTTAMIASEAGVSRGAMMHHFASRAEVMKAVITYLHDRLLEEYRELMARVRAPEKLDRSAVRRSVEAAWSYHNLPSFIAYQELLAAARTDAELGDVIGDFEKAFEEQYLSTAKTAFPQWEGVQSLQAAHDLVHFVMQGMASRYRLPNRKTRVDGIIDLVTDQLVRVYELEA